MSDTIYTSVVYRKLSQTVLLLLVKSFYSVLNRNI